VAIRDASQVSDKGKRKPSPFPVIYLHTLHSSFKLLQVGENDLLSLTSEEGLGTCTSSVGLVQQPQPLPIPLWHRPSVSSSLSSKEDDSVVSSSAVDPEPCRVSDGKSPTQGLVPTSAPENNKKVELLAVRGPLKRTNSCPAPAVSSSSSSSSSSSLTPWNTRSGQLSVPPAGGGWVPPELYGNGVDLRKELCFSHFDGKVTSLAASNGNNHLPMIICTPPADC